MGLCPEGTLWGEPHIVPHKLYKLESTSKCKTPFCENLQILYRKTHLGSGGRAQKNRISNCIGGDVDRCVTLAVVMVLLGLDAMKRVFADEARRALFGLIIQRRMPIFNRWIQSHLQNGAAQQMGGGENDDGESRSWKTIRWWFVPMTDVHFAGVSIPE